MGKGDRQLKKAKQHSLFGDSSRKHQLSIPLLNAKLPRSRRAYINLVSAVRNHVPLESRNKARIRIQAKQDMRVEQQTHRSHTPFFQLFLTHRIIEIRRDIGNSEEILPEDALACRRRFSSHRDDLHRRPTLTFNQNLCSTFSADQ